VKLPELWEPVGTPIKRTFTHEELREIGAKLENEALDRFEYYEVLAAALPGHRAGVHPNYQASLDFNDESYWLGFGETAEDARRDLTQHAVDGLRHSLRVHLELAGPKPEGEKA
jgi:hypothetical protein